MQSCTDSSEAPFECGCASQDAAFKQHLQSASFSSHTSTRDAAAAISLLLQGSSHAGKIEFWHPWIKPGLLQLVGDGWGVRLAVPATRDGIAEGQWATAAAGTKPSPPPHACLAHPSDPRPALQVSGTNTEAAEQQLLGLPLPEHPSACSELLLFPHLYLANL